MRVAVVTPTIGSELLSQCMESVQRQSYQKITHYIFLDGEENFEKTHGTLQSIVEQKPIRTIALEENIGKGWYGHRVYAASSFLVNADVICYLDEDNWFEPCHIERLVEKLNEGYQWAFSLRKIYDKDGNFLFEDNCESLGHWPVYWNDKVFHIDTSSFAIRRDVAVKIGQAWYGQWGADRQFFSAVRQYFPNFGCTNEHTMCYRLDGNETSVPKEFFIEGNKVYSEKYKNDFPWKQKGISHVEEIGPGIKIVK